MSPLLWETEEERDNKVPPAYFINPDARQYKANAGYLKARAKKLEPRSMMEQFRATETAMLLSDLKVNVCYLGLTPKHSPENPTIRKTNPRVKNIMAVVIDMSSVSAERLAHPRRDGSLKIKLERYRRRMERLVR